MRESPCVGESPGETLEALQEGKAIADAALVAGKRGVQGCHSRVSD